MDVFDGCPQVLEADVIAAHYTADKTANKIIFIQNFVSLLFFILDLSLLMFLDLGFQGLSDLFQQFNLIIQLIFVYKLKYLLGGIWEYLYFVLLQRFFNGRFSI